MSWFSKLFGNKDTAGTGLKEKSEGVFTIDLLADKGSTYTPSKALGIETFFACVRDKAETIGQLPLNLYEYNRNNGRKRIIQGRAHNIFTQRPCDHMSIQRFLEMAVVTYESQGVFYAYAERNDRGSVMRIVPFKDQSNVTPNMDINGNVFYTYVTNDQKPVYLGTQDDLFIVDMFSLDGYRPVSPIQRQARLLGIADAQDETQKKQTEDGITAQMALSTDGLFSDTNAQERLREDMKKARGPNGKSHIPIFEQGLKPISLKLSPKDLELLGNKQFTTKRICEMTRVSPHRVGAMDLKSLDIEALDEAYMRNSLNPILTKIENEFNRFTPEGYRVEFNRKQFYAGSPHRLVEAVEREVKGGLASVNEGRIDLGREPIEGGDIFAIDNNNVTYGQWPEVREIQERLYGQANQQRDDMNNEDNTDEE